MQTKLLGLMTVVAAVAVAIAAAAFDSPPAARATFPGGNGKIAFVSDRDGNNEIYVMYSDGSAPTNLTDNPASDTNPVWSPDGSKLVFTSDRDGNDEIYLMSADGSGVRNLTNNPAPDAGPVWSPDGSRIAFVTKRHDPDPSGCFVCNSEVYVMQADGSGQTNITNDEWSDYSPTWSPDSTSVAFLLDEAVPFDGGGLSSGANIYIWNGRGVRQVTDYDERIMCCLTWSPTGTELAFSAGFGDVPNVFTIHLDARPGGLTGNVGYDTGPQWSPDGRHLLFYTTVYDIDEVYLVSYDFGGPINLTNRPGRDSMPRWSPDGSKIVFQSSRDDPNPDRCRPCNSEIYVMRNNGSGQRNITNHPASDTAPDWQPLVAQPATATPTAAAGTATPAATAAPAALPSAGSGGDDPSGAWPLLALLAAAFACSACLAWFGRRPK